MSVLATPQEIDALLAHFAIHSISERPKGGRACSIGGDQNAASLKELAIVIGTHREARECPISQNEAQLVVSEFVEAGSIPKDASFRNAVAHLIVNFSDMYVESGIDAFSFPSIHLHATSYETGRGEVWRTRPLHLKARRHHNEPVLHSSFPHAARRGN